MDDRTRVTLATLLGAVLGGTLGYLYLTERGGRVRAQINPALDAALVEFGRIRATADKARTVADEARRTLREITEEPARAAGR